MSQPIPGPPGLPILGNISDIDPADSVNSLGRLADTYGMNPSICQCAEADLNRRNLQAEPWWYRTTVYILPRPDERSLR